MAASLGWMLDAFDVMLFALVLKSIMTDLKVDPAGAGLLQSVTLLAAAAGGLIFGIIADRWGRTRALMFSIFLYSVFTAACGLATSALALGVFRVCLGLGMGGEWASGAALVSETWPDRDRGKALGFVQSSWAIGYALAAVTSWVVQDIAGLSWRVVFFVGILPAFLTFWIRRRVPEPEVWRKTKAGSAGVPAGVLPFSNSPDGTPALPGLFLITCALTLMNGFTMFAWWGLNNWVPSFLRSSTSGGIGLSNTAMTGFLIAMQAGMWLGYITFGYLSDRIGRKRCYVIYLLIAAVSVLTYAWSAKPFLLLLLGPMVAFFGTGYFSGFGAVTAEIYPTGIRATAQGLTYNLGRIASAAAPWLVGSMIKTSGYPAALSLASAAFVLAAVCWLFIPETKGKLHTES